MNDKRTVSVFVLLFLLLFSVVTTLADVESLVIDLVNIEREAHNLPPFQISQELTLAARLHSQDMGANNYFNHTSLDGRAFNERIFDAGYDYATCGENIAGGQPSPEAVVAAWMNSPGHRANILSPEYCDIGVGYAAIAGSDFHHYWTQDFGRRKGEAQCPAPVVSAPGTSATTGSTTSNSGGDGCFILTTRLIPTK